MSLLVWGLIWLAAACLLGLLVGKAIKRADVLDDRRRTALAAQRDSDIFL